MHCLLLKNRDKREGKYPNVGQSLLRSEIHDGTRGVEDVIYSGKCTF